MIGEAYYREDYPVGSEVMLRSNSSVWSKMGIYAWQNLGTIMGFIVNNISVDVDDSFDSVEVLWDNGVVSVTTLRNVILAKDKEDYFVEQGELRKIKFAIANSLTPYKGSRDGSAIEWWEVDVELERKIALICAGVSLNDIKLYDRFTLEGLSRLGRLVEALEMVNFSGDSLAEAERWFEYDMDFDRKVALVNAGVPLTDVGLYDMFTVGELKSLRYHLRVMQGVC